MMGCFIPRRAVPESVPPEHPQQDGSVDEDVVVFEDTTTTQQGLAT